MTNGLIPSLAQSPYSENTWDFASCFLKNIWEIVNLSGLCLKCKISCWTNFLDNPTPQKKLHMTSFNVGFWTEAE